MRSIRASRILFGVATLVVVLVLAYCGRAVLLNAVGGQLVRDDHPAAGADYIVLLMGDGTPMRAEAVCDAYRRGIAPDVLVANELPFGFAGLGLVKSDMDVHRDYLLGCGIPAEHLKILMTCDTTSTYEEAVCFREYFAALPTPPARIVVVTSWFHTSRAGWIFSKVLPLKVETIAAGAPDLGPREWWRHEDSFLSVFNEYLKWAYWLRRI